MLFGLTVFCRVILEDGGEQGLKSFAVQVLCFHQGEVSGAFSRRDQVPPVILMFYLSLVLKS